MTLWGARGFLPAIVGLSPMEVPIQGVYTQNIHSGMRMEDTPPRALMEISWIHHENVCSFDFLKKKIRKLFQQ